MSLSKKMFFGVITLLLTTLILNFSFSFSHYYNQTLDSSLQQTINVTKNVNKAMEDYLYQMDGIISAFQSNFYFNDSMGSVVNFFDEDENQTPSQTLYVDRTLNSLFSNLMIMRRDVQNIYLYINDKKTYQYSLNYPVVLGYNPKTSSWLKKALAADGTTIAIPPHIPEQVHSNKKVISFTRSLNILGMKKRLNPPVLLIDFSLDSIDNIIDSHIDKDVTSVLFLDESGNVVFQTEGAQSFTNNNITTRMLQTGSQVCTVKGIKYFVSTSEKLTNGWRILVLTTYSSAMKATNSFLVYTLILGLLLTLLSMGIFYVFSSYIFKPVELLKEGMNHVKQGDFKIRLLKSSNDEFGSLIDNFNLMTHKIEELIRLRYEEEIAKKDAQYQFLQAQINPHFIFNTLQIISSMAVVKKDFDIETVANSLAVLIRYSINSDSKEISILEEVKNTKSYLNIQKIRFKNLFEYEIRMDSDVADCRIIKLILQPIVENALTHGIEPKGENGRILITIQKREADIFLCVWDNGVGLNFEQLERLREYIENKNCNSLNNNHTGNNVGLKNINNRLKLYYGEAYRLLIESEYGSGTKVTIHIPVERGSIT